MDFNLLSACYKEWAELLITNFLVVIHDEIKHLQAGIGKYKQNADVIPFFIS